MKKLSELMDELGFEPEGSPAVKEAFIKYLMKASEGVNVLTPTEKTLIKADPQKIKILPLVQKPVQLAFDFEETAKPKTRISGKGHK